MSDSRAIQDYYVERYKTPSTFIAYGAHVESSERPEILDEYDLKPAEYFFVEVVSNRRTTPTRQSRCSSDVKTDKYLVIAGGANWKSPVRGEPPTDP